MGVIRAEHYDDTVEVLKKDPIVKELANELPEGYEGWMNSSGEINWEFMTRSLHEYHKRGGKGSGHISGVAEAVVALLQERDGEVNG